jgi:hypothetical protein
MKPESEAMLQALLDWHNYHCVELAQTQREECIVPYGVMCENAGVPHLTHACSPFLYEVAEWCVAFRPPLPPINALAVNAETRIPGNAYNEAPGCHSANWEDEVREVIACRRYPRTV